MILQLDIDDPRWLEFVSASDGATAFHHPAWARLLMDCYRYPAFALAVADGAGRITAGLPVLDVSTRLRGRRLISLPYTDVCPPLVSDNGALNELVAGLDDERKRRAVSTFEIRARLPVPDTQRRSEAVFHTLSLTIGSEALERGLKPAVRRHIAKGNRLGLTVRRADAVADVAGTFFRLHLRTRRRLGVPVQPRRYFAGLWERIIEPGLGFCLVVESEERPVASAIFLAWGETLIYKYGASDERFLGLRPNHVLFWEAIRWGAANGYGVFDMGRTDLEQGGLRYFKSSWGAREEPLVYSILGGVGGSIQSTRSTKLLGSVIRRSPPLLCRALGELLYRYAA